MPYCVQADIESQFRRWFPDGFSTATKPTAVDVNNYITDIGNYLDGIIYSFGFTVPVVQPQAMALLKMPNVYGASAAAARVAFPEKIGADKDAFAAEMQALYEIEIKDLRQFDNELIAILQETFGTRKPISNYTQYPANVIDPPTEDPTIDLAPMFPRSREY